MMWEVRPAGDHPESRRPNRLERRVGASAAHPERQVRFAPEVLMSWCEGNGVHYVFGLARNPLLCPWGDGEPHQGGTAGPLCRSALQPPSAPTSCGCGSPPPPTR